MSAAPTLGEIALDAARAGAAAIRTVVDAGALRTEFKTAGHDMVTAADKASERAILAVLRAARPDDSIVGEEGGSYEGPSAVRWLVDPLDGTANFVYGRADYAVSVGATVDGLPAAGAIIRPADGRWLAGEHGGADGPGGVGATGLVSGFGGVRTGVGPAGISTSAAALPARTGGLAQAMVAVGLPYSLTERRRVMQSISSLMPLVRGVRVMGSAAGDLAAVALGQCDAFLGFGLAEWDTAAGHALVLAAGGTALEVGSQTPSRVLVAGGAADVVHALADLVDA
jgi:myo-inositol-1(or 4)-monophosphatase